MSTVRYACFTLGPPPSPRSNIYPHLLELGGEGGAGLALTGIASKLPNVINYSRDLSSSSGTVFQSRNQIYTISTVKPKPKSVNKNKFPGPQKHTGKVLYMVILYRTVSFSYRNGRRSRYAGSLSPIFLLLSLGTRRRSKPFFFFFGGGTTGTGIYIIFI